MRTDRDRKCDRNKTLDRGHHLKNVNVWRPTAQCFGCQDQGHNPNTWVGHHRLVHTLSFPEELPVHFDANGSDASGPGTRCSGLFWLAEQSKPVRGGSLQTSECHGLCCTVPVPVLCLSSQVNSSVQTNLKKNPKGHLKKPQTSLDSLSTLFHLLQSTSSLGLSLSRGVMGTATLQKCPSL